uniref:Rho GDP-dissociation inhibitor 1 n=1 Tax=Arundo donax TaxID=35708 RepID=A0A0A9CIG3_ARUDO
MEAVFTQTRTLKMKPRGTGRTKQKCKTQTTRVISSGNCEAVTQAGLVAAGEGSARRRPLPADVKGVVDLQVALPVVVEELSKQEHTSI